MAPDNYQGPFSYEPEDEDGDLKVRVLTNGAVLIRVDEDMATAVAVLPYEIAARLRDWLTFELARFAA